jgi:hypothetical protein
MPYGGEEQGLHLPSVPDAVRRAAGIGAQRSLSSVDGDDGSCPYPTSTLRLTLLIFPRRSTLIRYPLGNGVVSLAATHLDLTPVSPGFRSTAAELRTGGQSMEASDEADRTPDSGRAPRDTGTALLNPPPQRNSAAPDAFPLTRLDAKQTGRAKPPGVCLVPFVPARAPRRQFVL